MDFDWGEIGKILTYLIPAVILILTNVVFRKKHQQKAKLTVVRGLLSEIEHNQKLIGAFSLGWPTEKFKTGTWKRNMSKMDYIEPSLRYTLAEANEIAEEFNREIEAAKKHKSTSYLAGSQVDRLSKPLAMSKEGLEEWLLLSKDKEKSPLGAK